MNHIFMLLYVFMSDFYFCSNPTKLFTILELQNPSDDVCELHKIPCSPDLEVLKF